MQQTNSLKFLKLQGNKIWQLKYTGIIADKIKAAIPELFLDERGMLRASTGKSSQADVWSTGLAVYLKILEGDNNGEGLPVPG